MKHNSYENLMYAVESYVHKGTIHINSTQSIWINDRYQVITRIDKQPLPMPILYVNRMIHGKPNYYWVAPEMDGVPIEQAVSDERVCLYPVYDPLLGFVDVSKQLTACEVVAGIRDGSLLSDKRDKRINAKFDNRLDRYAIVCMYCKNHLLAALDYGRDDIVYQWANSAKLNVFSGYQTDFNAVYADVIEGGCCNTALLPDPFVGRDNLTLFDTY